MEISIELKNADQIRRFLATRPERTKEELNRAIKKSVLAVERETKIRSPVKTGRMRASVMAKEYPLETKGEVGVGVRYAIFVHEGTRYMRGRPFLANAVKVLVSTIQRYFQQAIKNVAEK